jgi:hypothetical protein
MRTPIAAALCCAALLLAGCASDSSDIVHSVLGSREAPRTRVFQGEPRAIYEATRAAAEGMGYRFVHGGPAEGRLEALSGISGGDDSGSSRQISLKVRIGAAEDAGCEVTASFTEIIEESSGATPAMATETPLRDTPLYEVFFRNVQQALNAGGAGK